MVSFRYAHPQGGYTFLKGVMTNCYGSHWDLRAVGRLAGSWWRLVAFSALRKSQREVLVVLSGMDARGHNC